MQSIITSANREHFYIKRFTYIIVLIISSGAKTEDAPKYEGS